MSILQSRNPAMRVLENEDVLTVERQSVMTLGGTVTATGILLSIVAVVGVLVWQAINSAAVISPTGGVSMPAWAWPALIGSMVAGLVISLIIAFKPKSAPFLAPVHAVLEGVFVGAATFVIPMQFVPMQADGTNPSAMLALQAAGATLAIAGAMLAGYASGILRVGPLVQKIMVTMLIGLLGYTALLWILSFVGVGIWNGYADTGMMGIGFTVLCAGLASLFLLLDFQYIEAGVQQRAPKYMEWVGAWGLMVTLVWLYIELLRLLSKLQARE
ncbi:MAG: Bax inhibitor-1/YccA family protein [bacterium]|nr:Bax inhibitor-1/YccA family protein [bacterium]